jgi:hypothetical protein
VGHGGTRFWSVAAPTTLCPSSTIPPSYIPRVFCKKPNRKIAVTAAANGRGARACIFFSPDGRPHRPPCAPAGREDRRRERWRCWVACLLHSAQVHGRRPTLFQPLGGHKERERERESRRRGEREAGRTRGDGGATAAVVGVCFLALLPTAVRSRSGNVGARTPDARAAARTPTTTRRRAGWSRFPARRVSSRGKGAVTAPPQFFSPCGGTPARRPRHRAPGRARGRARLPPARADAHSGPIWRWR